MRIKKKGFTLIELIIVIAIIGVLSAIIIPAWMNYIQKSRIKTQNSNSKVVFNAAQTIITDYSFRERKLDLTDAESVTDGDFYLTWSNGVAHAYTSLGGDEKSSALANDIASRINRVFAEADNTTYTVYVNNYLVQSVVSGRTNTDRFKGSYPVVASAPDKGTTVLNYDMESKTL